MATTPTSTPPTLVINAGGQSRRMGRTKALLPVPPDGVPLLHHMVRRVAGVPLAKIVVVANDPAVAAAAGLPKTVRWVADAYPDTGVLGGIATGLELCPDWAVVLACDMPLINAVLIDWLATLRLEVDGRGEELWDAIVPMVDGYEQTMHALYHRRCLPAIYRALAEQRRRVVSFFPDVRVRSVSETAVAQLDPGCRSFGNANTPDEWDAVLQELRGGRK